MAKGKQERPTTAALRMMIVPMLRAGMTYEQIAPSFDKSPGTIKRWAAHPDVVAALGEAHEQALAVANEDALDVARQAWRTLSALMDDEDVDPRVRLDAAKTVLSRKGEPEATKSESRVERVEPPRSPVEARERLEKLHQKLRVVGGSGE